MTDFDCPINLQPEVSCRICLEVKPLENLFVKEIIDGEILVLPMLFQQLFRIKILHKDGLPQKICSECKQKLIESTKFKRKCEASNKILHEVLNPGYNYKYEEVSETRSVAVAEIQTDTEIVEKNEFGTQTEEITTKPASDDSPAEDEIFNHGIDFHQFISKIDKNIDRFSDKINEQEATWFRKSKLLMENKNIVIKCSINECEETIQDNYQFQSHVKTYHNEILLDLHQKLNEFEQQIENIEEVEEQNDQEMEQQTEVQIIENYEVSNVEEELVQVEEYIEEVTEIDDQTLSYHCPICHKLYKGTEAIQNHQLMHDMVLPTLFTHLEHYCCETCHHVFTSINEVNEHFSLCNSLSNYVSIQMETESDEVRKKNNDEFNSLPTIPAKLYLFKKHVKIESENAPDDSQTFLEMTGIDFDNETPGQCLVCGMCQKNYSSVEAIRYHTLCHFKNFNCPLKECDAEFDFCYKLLSHMRYAHLKDKNTELSCNYCKEVFNNKKDYAIHLKDLCIQRTFVCGICSKKFVNQAALKNHEKTHEKPKCEECGETFETSSALRSHVKKYHSEDKMYKCNLCDKRFRTPSHRNDHENTHTSVRSFQCDICMNLFKSERVLKNHLKIHFLGKTHACPVCGKMFSRNYHVKLHLKTHKEWTEDVNVIK